MRYIDPREVELARPADWADTVRKAVAYVDKKVKEAEEECAKSGMSRSETETAVHSARSKAINAKSHVWSDAGKVLRGLSNDKCWYCETDELRSDMPVDHFRPKNSVVECSGNHLGYWWLAFEWSNYRLACTYCNSRRVFEDSEGGKHDHFPLLDENKRAYKRADESNESPMLLDPCDVDDVDHLTFIDTGQVWEAEGNKRRHRYRRANKSIELYHLNHTKTVRERHLIAITIRDRVQRVAELFDVKRRTGQDTRELKTLTAELLSFVRSGQRFSTAARVYLSKYRHFPFVDSILQKA